MEKVNDLSEMYLPVIGSQKTVTDTRFSSETGIREIALTRLLAILYMTARCLTFPRLEGDDLAAYDWICRTYEKKRKNIEEAAVHDFEILRDYLYRNEKKTLPNAIITLKTLPNAIITLSQVKIGDDLYDAAKLRQILEPFDTTDHLTGAEAPFLWTLAPLLDPGKTNHAWKHDKISDALIHNTLALFRAYSLPCELDLGDGMVQIQEDILPVSVVLPVLMGLRNCSRCYLSGDSSLVPWLAPVVDKNATDMEMIVELDLRPDGKPLLDATIEKLSAPTDDVLRNRLLEKMEEEQRAFKAGLLRLSKEKILERAYEYGAREDLLLAVSENNLGREAMETLLAMEAPLAACYGEWMDRDKNYMLDMFSCIEDIGGRDGDE